MPLTVPTHTVPSGPTSSGRTASLRRLRGNVVAADERAVRRVAQQLARVQHP